MINRALIFQVGRFGIVGVSAAVVNFAVVVAIVEWFGWNPLLANIVAFAIAYQVSFFGHNYWTFGRQTATSIPWLKFLLVALASFALSESLFFVFLHFVGLYYPIALILVLIMVPPITFVLSKFWAFR